MQESRGKFESQFFKLLSEDLAEENMSVGGGALGTAAQGGTIFNPDSQINSADTYAPGDARKPKMLGGVQTRSGSASKKKKDKKKKGIDGVFLTGEEDEEGKSDWERDYKYECECGEKWLTKEARDSCKECNG
jgi:hypothetical protein|tara:strand:- start:758 stop:1156 length:399 start_codon:yes stop_codon:yes gene_type:complete